MTEYLVAANELDARWTFALKFLPNSRMGDDLYFLPVAALEIDLFNSLSHQIARRRGLNRARLVETYDFLLTSYKL